MSSKIILLNIMISCLPQCCGYVLNCLIASQNNTIFGTSFLIDLPGVKAISSDLPHLITQRPCEPGRKRCVEFHANCGSVSAITFFRYARLPTLMSNSLCAGDVTTKETQGGTNFERRRGKQ